MYPWERHDPGWAKTEKIIFRFFFEKYFSKTIFRKTFFKKYFSKNIFQKIFSKNTVWGGGAVIIISKNLPLKGKFFEMVSWGGLGGLAPLRNLRYPCLAPRGVWGASPPQESPLPVPCPRSDHALPPIYAHDHNFFRNFFVQFFFQNFFVGTFFGRPFSVNLF